MKCSELVLQYNKSCIIFGLDGRLLLEMRLLKTCIGTNCSLSLYLLLNNL